MVQFKGRSALKWHIPKQPYEWGDNVFVLCNMNGLVHSFDIFTGKPDPGPGQPDPGVSGYIVLRLSVRMSTTCCTLMAASPPWICLLLWPKGGYQPWGPAAESPAWESFQCRLRDEEEG